MNADDDLLRAGWFIPHETTIILPDGREITVEGIPYEGWGTEPGSYGYLYDYEETAEGGFTFSDAVSWTVVANRVPISIQPDAIFQSHNPATALSDE